MSTDTEVTTNEEPTTEIDYSDPNAVADALTSLEPEIENISDEEEEETEQEETDDDLEDDEDDEDEQDDADEDSDQETDEGADEDDEDEDLFDEQDFKTVSDEAEVEIDGVNISVKELKDSYYRQSDYTKGKQEISAEREKLKAFEKEAIAFMSQGVQKYQLMLDDANTIDMVQLAETDPRKYARVSASIQQIQSKIAAETKVVQDWHNNYQAEKDNETERAVEMAMPIVEERIPGFNEAKAVEILQYAEELGMSEEDARGLTDPYVIIALEKAMRFDRAKSKAKIKREPKKASGKAIRNKSSADVRQKETKSRTALKERMKNTTNPEELADIMTRLQLGDK